MGCFTCKEVSIKSYRELWLSSSHGGVSGGTIEITFSMRNYKSKYSIGHPFLLNSKEYIKTQIFLKIRIISK